MIIRTATAEDWPAIYPFLRTTMDEGRTYAWPAGQPSVEALSLIHISEPTRRS